MLCKKSIQVKIIKYDAHILLHILVKTPSSKSGKMKWLTRETKFKRSKIHTSDAKSKTTVCTDEW